MTRRARSDEEYGARWASSESWLCGLLHRFPAKNHVVNLKDELDDLRGQ